MKITDLRIGNYIRSKHSGEITQVYELFQEDDGDIVNDSLIDSFEPIPLTEEWLFKFGVEQGGYDLLFWTKESSMGIFTISGHTDIGFGVRYNDEIEPQLKYVHQLQNLYHSLTGEELVLKMH